MGKAVRVRSHSAHCRKATRCQRRTVTTKGILAVLQQTKFLPNRSIPVERFLAFIRFDQEARIEKLSFDTKKKPNAIFVTRFSLTFLRSQILSYPDHFEEFPRLLISYLIIAMDNKVSCANDRCPRNFRMLFLEFIGHSMRCFTYYYQIV